MGRPISSRPGRFRERLRLSQVQEASDSRLRDRWQRRLDGGEVVLCRQCRLRGVATRIDPEHWHLVGDTRVPGCEDCHAQEGAPSRAQGHRRSG